MLGKQQESGGEEARSTGWITAAFLTVCGLCGRALGPGKDTYIYRGEVAFCSNECREWYIKHTERNRSLGEIGTAPKP